VETSGSPQGGEDVAV